jgi:nucleoid DNA-binding protein
MAKGSKETAINCVTEKLGKKTGSVKEVIDALFRVLEEGMQKNRKISIHGYGYFSIKEIEEHTKPVAGKVKKIRAKKKVVFVTGAKLIKNKESREEKVC